MCLGSEWWWYFPGTFLLISASLSHFPRTLSKTPSLSLEEPQELTFARAILVSDSPWVDPFMPTPHAEQQEYPYVQGDVTHAELAGAVRLRAVPMLTLPTATSLVAHFHPCQGPSWCSGIQDQGSIATWGYCESRETFVHQHPQTAAQCALARQGRASWRHTSCLSGFKKGSS